MAEHTYVLGVSCHYHDAAAALVRDGEVLAAAQEERFTRVKGAAELPVHVIEFVLDAAGIEPDALDLVCFYESPTEKFDRILSTQLIGRPRALPTFTRAMQVWLPEKPWVLSRLRSHLGRGVRCVAGDHHMSHAASAFYPSPFESALVLTADGVGEWSTTSIGFGQGSSLEILEHIEYPNSLGMLYSAFTLYCGFKINSGEYKLMGLAPYGTPRFLPVIREHIAHISQDGSLALNPEVFAHFDGSRTFNDAFCRALGERPRSESDPLSEHYADVAASIQAFTNEAVLAMAAHGRDLTGSPNIVLAGGVALNVVSVGELDRSGLFENVWVQPAAGDAGGSLGAALWASHTMLEVPRSSRTGDGMRGALLGPEPSVSDADTAELLAGEGIVHHRLGAEDMAQRIAELVAAGQVVGLARGPMEFGPRALGARSILADARDARMQLRLNLKTKFREGFRPFAPIVLVEDADAVFEMSSPESPYMLKTFQVRGYTPAEGGWRDPYDRVKETRGSLPAITHVDGSARVQTVDAERHPFVYDVLTRFKQLTGCPAMVNTSFNVRGEPIVCSARDALECFLSTDIDALVIGDRLVLRAEQSAAVLASRRQGAKGAD